MTCDPIDPSSYQRRILVATLGLAPQVLTETLWCLAMRQVPAFVPTEIHVVTTLEGAHRARLTLLAAEAGQMAMLAHDLDQPHLEQALTPERIRIISGPNGDGLNDIDSLEHNAAAADLITGTIREFAADPQCAMHVSIAGGRKTMGFLLGYALSLYGRPQDRLSHVLVSSPFEGHPEFFFPPKRPVVLRDRDQRPFSTSEAQLILAEIPFVSLRPQLPSEVLDGRWSYTETVELARNALRPGSMLFDTASGKLTCQGVDVDLAPQTFALAAWFGRRLLDHGPKAGAVHWRTADWSGYIDAYKAVNSVTMTQVAELQSRLSDRDKQGKKELFQEHLSRLRTAIRNALGPAAQPYLPTRFGRRPETRVGFSLEPQRISFL